MAPKIAIIYYTTWGHVRNIALSVQAGVKAAGGEADLFQIPETLSDEVLEKMHAPAKPEDPIATPETLKGYDGFLFGIPTRFGNFPAQWKAFWDATGGLWSTGALHGKYAGIFVSTGTPGGGQEITVLNALSVLAHHGLIYVPLGYKNSFAQLTNIEEVTVALPGALAPTLTRTALELLRLWSLRLLRFRARVSTRLLPELSKCVCL